MKYNYPNWDDYFYYDELSPSGLKWKVDRFTGRYGKVKNVAVGDIAGCLDGEGYFVVRLLGRAYKTHRIIYELMEGQIGDLQIDHINGDPSDNKIENLRVVTSKENHRNRKIQSTNTSGIAGVHLHTKGRGYQSWVATWYSLDGKKRAKYFPINKYGNSEAFRLACEHRVMVVAELNELGAGYSIRHGT